MSKKRKPAPTLAAAPLEPEPRGIDGYTHKNPVPPPIAVLQEIEGMLDAGSYNRAKQKIARALANPLWQTTALRKLMDTCQAAIDKKYFNPLPEESKP